MFFSSFSQRFENFERYPCRDEMVSLSNSAEDFMIRLTSLIPNQNHQLLARLWRPSHQWWGWSRRSCWWEPRWQNVQDPSKVRVCHYKSPAVPYTSLEAWQGVVLNIFSMRWDLWKERWTRLEDVAWSYFLFRKRKRQKAEEEHSSWMHYRVFFLQRKVFSPKLWLFSRSPGLLRHEGRRLQREDLPHGSHWDGHEAWLKLPEGRRRGGLVDFFLLDSGHHVYLLLDGFRWF